MPSSTVAAKNSQGSSFSRFFGVTSRAVKASQLKSPSLAYAGALRARVHTAAILSL